MKRYQCIKTIRHELFEFEPGSIYNFTVNPGENFYGHKTQTGRIIWLTSQKIREHFQELLDLNVDDPYTDAEAHEYELMQPEGCIRGAVWAIVITAVVVILYAIFG